MKISVLGCGRWGSFIAWYLTGQGHDVTLWGRTESASFQRLNTSGENDYVKLNSATKLTDNLALAVSRAEIIVISISSQSLRDFVRNLIPLGIDGKTFVLCMKGIELDTGKRLSEILSDEGIDPNRIAVWVGPGHIQSFVKGLPNCMVIDSTCSELVKDLADSLRSDLIRFYYGDDIIGTEIGAAAKNVMGIAAGMLDGGGYSTLKGPLMARGAREVARLIKALGGNELSAYGLAHLGDYETTLFSEYSHNRSFGEAWVKGERFSKLAEGVTTARAIQQLGQRLSVDLPITNAVCSIIYDGKDPMQVFLSLFSRSTRKEFV